MSAAANIITNADIGGLRTHPIRLAADIRDEHKHAQQDHLSAVQHAIRCGRLLIEAKAGIAHGEWEKWIDAHCRFAHRTAQGYIRLARLDAAKAQRVADLSLRQALKDIGEEFGRKQKRIERQVDRELKDTRKPVVHDGVAVHVDDRAPEKPTVAVNVTIESAPADADVQSEPSDATEWITHPIPVHTDAIAKLIIGELEKMEQAQLTDPAWFAGQLGYHASRLNPLKIAFKTLRPTKKRTSDALTERTP